MIYEKYEKMYNAIPYVDAKKFKEEQWEKFQAKTTKYIAGGDMAGLKNFIKQEEANHHEEVKALLLKRRDERYAAEIEVNEAFQEALEAEYLGKMRNQIYHGRMTMLWKKAWEMGHANGYHDVEAYYADLAPLIFP